MRDLRCGILSPGTHNIGSVKNYLGAISSYGQVGLDIVCVDSAKQLSRCDVSVVPGVCNFEIAVKGIRAEIGENNFLRFIREQGRLLCICGGMQILYERSGESGIEGFGIFEGGFEPFDKALRQNIGWGIVRPVETQINGPRVIESAKRFFFAHSYAMTDGLLPNDLRSTYRGLEFSAGRIQKEIVALQFHPELSGANGIELGINYFRSLCVD